MKSARALLALILLAAATHSGVHAEDAATPQDTAVPSPTAPSLFAIEYRTGPGWDTAKAPAEQSYFRDHSAQLRGLREAGVLVMGARYGDKGLVILSAASLDEARALVEADPSVRHGTFVYELHPFSVFYGGTLDARRTQQPASRK